MTSMGPCLAYGRDAASAKQGRQQLPIAAILRELGQSGPLCRGNANDLQTDLWQLVGISQK